MAETTAPTACDRRMVDLIDAVVLAIDTDRYAEVARVRSVLEPFDAAAMFDAELRLNGTPSTDSGEARR